MKILSKVPSKLIRLALKDLRKVELSTEYKVNMDDWHVPANKYENASACFVCLAGAVMAGTLDADIKSDIVPQDFTGNRDALIALDEFRSGQITWAFDSLAIPIPVGMEYVIPMPAYEEKPEQFHEAMEYLASEFESRGY